jgi:hypothetical protein
LANSTYEVDIDRLHEECGYVVPHRSIVRPLVVDGTRANCGSSRGGRRRRRPVVGCFATKRARLRKSKSQMNASSSSTQDSHPPHCRASGTEFRHARDDASAT